MIKLRVIDILNEKGKTKYWLFKNMDMSYQNFDNMIKNRTSAIKFKNIELLCELLECTPNDLFEFEDE